MHAFEVVECFVSGFTEVFEIKSGELAGFEGLEVPADDGDVATTGAVFAVGVVPASAAVLAVDEELAGGLHRFFELVDVFAEGFGAEGVGLGEGVGGDGVFVAPVVVFEVGGEFPVVFHGFVDEVDDGGEDGFAEFLGLGGFAMPEVGLESGDVLLVGVHGDDEKDDADKDHGEQGDDEAGDGGGAALGVEARFGFGCGLGVETHDFF